MKIGDGTLVFWIAAMVVSGLAATASAGEAQVAPRPRAVVELFTSQGCANCPPADAYLSELAKDPGLVTLSFPVDYWDYLGWKDTAAKPEFGQRQRAYATRRGDHDVYTPQMIINGKTHLVGSDRAGIAREVEAAKSGLPVEVDLETRGDTLVVSVGEALGEAPTTGATVWIVRYDVSRQIAIRRGENNGRTIVYAHLVRSLQPIGMWKGRAVRIELPRQEVAPDSDGGCAVLVQTELDGGPGSIVGARVIQAAPRG